MYTICLCLWPEDLRAGSKFEVEPWLSQGAGPDHKADLFQSQQQQIPVIVMNHSG